jgi:hypothetical protein
MSAWPFRRAAGGGFPRVRGLAALTVAVSGRSIGAASGYVAVTLKQTSSRFGNKIEEMPVR